MQKNLSPLTDALLCYEARNIFDKVTQPEREIINPAQRKKAIMNLHIQTIKCLFLQEKIKPIEEFSKLMQDLAIFSPDQTFVDATFEGIATVYSENKHIENKVVAKNLKNLVDSYSSIRSTPKSIKFGFASFFLGSLYNIGKCFFSRKGFLKRQAVVTGASGLLGLVSYYSLKMDMKNLIKKRAEELKTK